MPDIILGTSEATEQPVRYGYDPQRGPFTQRSWRGIKSAIEALLPELTLAGYRWEVSRGPGDIWEISASIAADTSGGGGGNPNPTAEVVNDWELLPSVSQKDLLESNAWLVRQLTADEVYQVKYWLTTPEASKSPAWTNALYQEPLFRLMQAGVKSATVFQPVLRHTWLIPRNVNPGLVFSNIGMILSTGAMQGQEGLPFDFLLALNQITSEYQERVDGVDLAYGWLKGMPTLQRGASGRSNVTIEYQYGAWAALIYGDPI